MFPTDLKKKTPWALPKNVFPTERYCAYCEKETSSTASFLDEAICGICLEKVRKRIKLILKLE